MRNNRHLLIAFGIFNKQTKLFAAALVAFDGFLQRRSGSVGWSLFQSDGVQPVRRRLVMCRLS
jgi:hypothetical protein